MTSTATPSGLFDFDFLHAINIAPTQDYFYTLCCVIFCHCHHASRHAWGMTPTHLLLTLIYFCCISAIIVA